MKKGLIILFIFSMISGCQDIDSCGADPNVNYMVIRFFDLETKEAKNIGFEIISDNPRVQFLIAPDTTIVEEDTTIVNETEVLALPFNVEENTITYFFNSDTSNHELVIKYDKEFSIFDPDCEPSLTFTNLDTIRQTFDSTVIVSRVTQLLADPDTELQISNFEIYF